MRAHSQRLQASPNETIVFFQHYEAVLIDAHVFLPRDFSIPSTLSSSAIVECVNHMYCEVRRVRWCSSEECERAALKQR